MRQYLREARVLIGDGTAAIEIKNLAVRFECVKNQFSNRMPNQLTLTIINLKESTRSAITNHATSVRLEVGYGDTLTLLFEGKMSHAVHTHEGTEWLSTLYCWDLYREMKESRIALSIKAGVTVKYMIEQVLSTFGPPGVLYASTGIEHLEAQTILSDRPLSGSTRSIMNTLASDYDFGWGPQDGRMEMWGLNSSFLDTAIRISSANGMIDHPIVTDLGVEVTTLLNPALRPRRRIIIESVGAGVRVGSIEIREIIPQLQAGLYTIGEVVFSGATWEHDWTSKIKTFIPGTIHPGTVQR